MAERHNLSELLGFRKAPFKHRLASAQQFSFISAFAVQHVYSGNHTPKRKETNQIKLLFFLGLLESPKLFLFTTVND